MLADVVGADFGVARVRRTEQIIKAAHQRFVREQHVMLENTAHFVRKLILWDTVMVIKTGLRAPADMERGRNVRFRPLEDGAQLVPVFHVLKRHPLHRRAGNDHAVIRLAAHLIERLVEREHVLLGRVFRDVGFHHQQLQLHLNRRVAQQARQLRFGGDFGGHQVQQEDFQRANILRFRARIGHDEYVFAPQRAGGGQVVRNADWHDDVPRFCVLMAGFGAIDANLYFIILLLREMSNRG